MRRLSTAVFLALATAAGCASAPRATAQRPAAPDLEQTATALAPPPSPGSDEAKADLAIVLWLQRTRRAEDVERVRHDLGLGLGAFAPALGAGFDPARYPRTAALVERAHAFATGAIQAAKARYARLRPYEADARVMPSVREETPSYPSSHATRGVLVARVLARLAPGRRDALAEVGLRAGFDRVVAGAHYPSDVLAGQRLGEALAETLFHKNADFVREVEAVRATEWAPSGR